MKKKHTNVCTENCQKTKKTSLTLSLFLLFFTLALCESALAQERNLTVKIYTPLDFTDIWLGTSTGGYDLIAEKGTNYTFEIFVKNGMNNRSLHNVYLGPNNFPFEINSITPQIIENIKPMEIKRYFVNVSVPLNATEGKYQIKFDIGADEFPMGIFMLENELQVVRKLKTGLYATYAAISIIILALFFFRKYKLSKQKSTKMKYE
jgi:uncharacterized membrane protein